MRHVVTLFDLSSSEIEHVFAIAEEVKAKYNQGVREPLLPGRVLGLLFEKPSLRTRVSFEAGMAHLGGTSLFLGAEVGWQSDRESVQDFAAVISEMMDVVVCRAKTHETVATLAKHCKIPVINGLTNQFHPCQALADLFTLKERCGDLGGRKLAYIGDPNNVANSLAIACGRLQVRLAVASPNGYQFDSGFLKRLKEQSPNLALTLTQDPAEAVADADAVYTDVWASMGQEAERETRQKAFADYQVNEKLLKAAPENALFLHCLPARRGEEVTDGVIDGPNSAVLQQAANRMHVQKGLLAWLLRD